MLFLSVTTLDSSTSCSGIYNIAKKWWCLFEYVYLLVVDIYLLYSISVSKLLSFFIILLILLSLQSVSKPKLNIYLGTQSIAYHYIIVPVCAILWAEMDGSYYSRISTSVPIVLYSSFIERRGRACCTVQCTVSFRMSMIPYTVWNICWYIPVDIKRPGKCHFLTRYI